MIAFEAACELVQNQEHQEEAAGGTLHLDYELTYHGTPSALSKRNARLFANEKYAHAVYGAFLMEWRGDLGKQPFRDPPFLLPAEKMRFYSAFYRTLKYIVSNIGRRANKQPPYTLETPVRPAVTLPQLRGMAEICELLVLPCIFRDLSYDQSVEREQRIREEAFNTPAPGSVPQSWGPALRTIVDDYATEISTLGFPRYLMPYGSAIGDIFVSMFDYWQEAVLADHPTEDHDPKGLSKRAAS